MGVGMKGLRIFVPLFVILAFMVVVGCGGGSSDGVNVPTNSQVKISTIKEMSETGISANKEFSAKTNSAEITIPANSINSNYDISINKIETANLDSVTLAYLKNYYGFDKNVEFFSPIINYDITLHSSNSFRASLNIDSDGIVLNNLAEILIRSNKTITDWVNLHYYLAFCTESNGKWHFTPLKKEHFEKKLDQLSFKINKVGKLYVIIALPYEINEGIVPELPEFTGTETNTSTSSATSTNTQTQTSTNTDTSTDTDIITALNIYANPDNLIASDSGKFSEDMKLYVNLEYDGSNPFAFTTPTIEFLSFTPFDLGNSIRSNSQKNYFIYNYKNFMSPENDVNGIATFVLTLPTKNIKYDTDKHPENIFVTAKFKSKSNKDYQSEPIKISFVYNPPIPVIATPSVITSLNICLNETQLLIATDSNKFNNDLIIDGNIYYEGSKPSFDVTPIFIEFTSANRFNLGYDDYYNNIIGTFDGNIYSCLCEIPSCSIRINEESKSASFTIDIPLINTIYDKEKHPENIFIKAKIDNKESNQVVLKINKLQEPIGEIPPGNLIVNTVFPNNSNYLNGSGSIRLALSWLGDAKPFTANFKYNNDIIYSVASITENRIDVDIPTYNFMDSNGEKYIEIEVCDFANRSSSAISKPFIIDIEPPVLVASVTNGSVFSVKGNVQILITSNKTIKNPLVSCEEVNAELSETIASNTQFIYTLQLNSNFANGEHQICVIASDTTEPAEFANANMAIATFTVDTSISFPFANGSGTASDPFLIATAEDLNNVRHYPDCYYKQIADIDLGEFIDSRTDTAVYPSNSDTNSTVGWLPIANFSGVYDGDSHEIRDIWLNRDKDNVGLFGNLVNNSIIKNIKLVGNSKLIVGLNYVGSIAGRGNSTIENCSSNLNVLSSARELNPDSGNYIGGIIGSGLNVKECNFTGKTLGCNYVGGIAGECENVYDSISSGTVCGLYNVGGITGRHLSGLISNSMNHSLVKGSYFVGGITGISEGSKIINCNSYNELQLITSGGYNFDGIAYGVVLADSNTGVIGGIAGYITGFNSWIYNCNVTSNINSVNDFWLQSSNLGGIVGSSFSDGLHIDKCVFKGDLNNHEPYSLSNSNYWDGCLGGIIASSTGNNTMITSCYVESNIYLDGASYVGGIVGLLAGSHSEISKCISNSRFGFNIEEGNNNGSCRFIGGIAGYVDDYMQDGIDISKCISKNIFETMFSESNGTQTIRSGIAGFCEHSSLNNNYSLSSITNSCLSPNGGLVGQSQDGTNINNNIMLGKLVKATYVYNDRDDSHRILGFNSGEAAQLNNNYSWNGVSNDLGNSWKEPIGSETNQGADASKSEFWGASTQQSFWVNKLGWDFDIVWEFRAGYNLPQLRGLPSIEDPEYLVNAD